MSWKFILYLVPEDSRAIWRVNNPTSRGPLACTSVACVVSGPFGLQVPVAEKLDSSVLGNVGHG